MKGKMKGKKRWLVALCFACGAVLGLHLFSQYALEYPGSWAGRSATWLYRAINPLGANLRVLGQVRQAAPQVEAPAVEPALPADRGGPNQRDPRQLAHVPDIVEVLEPILVEPIAVELVPGEAVARRQDLGGEEECVIPVQVVARRTAPNQRPLYMPYADEPVAEPVVETTSGSLCPTFFTLFWKPFALLAKHSIGQGLTDDSVVEESEEPLCPEEEGIHPHHDYVHPPHCPYSGRCLPSHYRNYEIPRTMPLMPKAQDTLPAPQDGTEVEDAPSTDDPG